MTGTSTSIVALSTLAMVAMGQEKVVVQYATIGGDSPSLDVDVSTGLGSRYNRRSPGMKSVAREGPAPTFSDETSWSSVATNVALLVLAIVSAVVFIVHTKPGNEFGKALGILSISEDVPWTKMEIDNGDSDKKKWIRMAQDSPLVQQAMDLFGPKRHKEQEMEMNDPLSMGPNHRDDDDDNHGDDMVLSARADLFSESARADCRTKAEAKLRALEPTSEISAKEMLGLDDSGEKPSDSCMDLMDGPTTFLAAESPLCLDAPTTLLQDGLLDIGSQPKALEDEDDLIDSNPQAKAGGEDMDVKFPDYGQFDKVTTAFTMDDYD